MKKLLLLVGTIFILANLSLGQVSTLYGSVPKDTITDIYFGNEISDPYQWMEDLSDPRLQLWLDEQQSLTKKVSNKQIRKTELRAQLVSMYNDVNRNKTNLFLERKKEFDSKYEFDEKITNYSKSSDLMFRKKGNNNYRLLIRAKDFIEEKKDKLSYNSINVNKEGKFVVVTTSINGKDWGTGYIFNLKTGEQLPHVIQNLNGSNLEWHGNTLYFDAYNAPLRARALKEKANGQKLYKLEIEKDNQPQLIYTNQDTTGTNGFSFLIEDDHFFLYHFIKSRSTIYKTISHADLKLNSFFPKRFLVYPNEQDINLSIAHVSNDSVWLKTNWNAPNGKILLSNINNSNELTEFIPEYDIILNDLDPLGNDKLVLRYSNKGQDIALIFDLKGQLLKRIDFPKGKRVKYLYETEKVEHTTFSLSSFYHPDLTYQISLEDLEFKPVESLTVPYDVHKIETKYVSFLSKDGTEVSMYVTCKKDLVLDGNNPVMLYGYGGYGSTVEPFFNHSNALFIAHGGILAVPNIRGGGAKGSNWALAGRRLNKQNSIDDFIGAAEYLINEKYTNPQKLLISGSSHGALLVTSAMMQRPELFHSVIAEAGPYDMLRLHRYTVGRASTNILEFGTPNNKEDYLNLKSYSPLHNVKDKVQYPKLLLLTGSSDDRVPPFHTYKFLATLQEKAEKGAQYVLFKTDGAGHGPALTQNDFEEKILFETYFIFDELQMKFY